MDHCKFRNARQSAFTLSELLVVIVLTVVLATLTVVGSKALRQTSDKSVCVNNLRQISAALAAYLSDNRMIYPHYSQSYVADENGKPKWIGDKAWNGLLLDRGYITSRRTFICPAARGQGKETLVDLGNISYGINIAITFNYPTIADWPQIPASSYEITAETIVLADAAYRGLEDTGQYFGAYYMYPMLYETEWSGQAWPRHTGACNVLWGDGRVTAVKAAVPSNPKTIYHPNALGRIYDAPRHWLRRGSPYNP